MTLQQIVDEVAFNLNRDGVSDVESRIEGWAQEEIRQWALEAAWKGQPHNWTFLRSTQTITMVAATDSYALNADMLRPIRFWVNNTSWGQRIQIGDLQELTEAYTGSADSYIERYAVDFETSPNLLWLFPGPAQAWTGYFRYLKAPATLALGASNEFTANYSEGIICGATYRGLRRLRMHAEAAEWFPERIRLMVDAVRTDRRRLVEGDMVLAVSTGAENDPRHPNRVSDDTFYPDRMIDPASYES